MELAKGVGGFSCKQALQAKKVGELVQAKVGRHILGGAHSLRDRELTAALWFREVSRPSSFRIDLPDCGFQQYGDRESSSIRIFSARAWKADRYEAWTSDQTEHQGSSGRVAGQTVQIGGIADGVFAAFSSVSGNFLAASDAIATTLSSVGSLHPERVATVFPEWRYSIKEKLTMTSVIRELAVRMQEYPESSARPPTRDWRIRSGTGDDSDPQVQWEQAHEYVIGERTLTRPGFSFSAAGLLFPYHLGVCQCLIEHGYIDENTQLAGSSAGALVCVVVAGGLSMERAMQATRELAENCRVSGTAFRLGGVLRSCMEKFLPDDVHLRVNGRIRVAVTQVFRTPRGLLVDKFDSKEDLINALFTSCFVPGFLAPRPATKFRDRYCVDGGISLFVPPTGAESTVRVSAFPCQTFGLRGIEINPDCNPSISRPSTKQLLSWALEPPCDAMLDNLFRLGEVDARSWVTKNQEAQRKTLEATFSSCSRTTTSL